MKNFSMNWVRATEEHYITKDTFQFEDFTYKYGMLVEKEIGRGKSKFYKVKFYLIPNPDEYCERVHNKLSQLAGWDEQKNADNLEESKWVDCIEYGYRILFFRNVDDYNIPCERVIYEKDEERLEEYLYEISLIGEVMENNLELYLNTVTNEGYVPLNLIKSLQGKIETIY